ncbi:MAG: hypothetical protein K6B70_07490 [Clostridia bacterium]|nr:hypothetical protein [Clostridia bacterium]
MNNMELADYRNSISKAKVSKEAYATFFENELLAQISKIVEGLPYRDLVRLNGKSIKITQHNQIKATTISIGYVENYVQCISDLCTDYRHLQVKLSDIYTGFRTAYAGLIKKITEGAVIPGIICKSTFLGKKYLVIDI